MSRWYQKREMSERLLISDFLPSILILPLFHEWHIPQASLIPQICPLDRSIFPYAYHFPS